MRVFMSCLGRDKGIYRFVRTDADTWGWISYVLSVIDVRQPTSQIDTILASRVIRQCAYSFNDVDQGITHNTTVFA